MTLVTKDDAILCRALASTLVDDALEWFLTQPPKSINNYTDFKRKFIDRFSASGSGPVRKQELCGIKQKAGEGIASYTERFMKVENQISNLDHSNVIMLYMAGRAAGHFKRELGMRLPKTSGELYDLVTGYCGVDETDDVPTTPATAAP